MFCASVLSSMHESYVLCTTDASGSSNWSASQRALRVSQRFTSHKPNYRLYCTPMFAICHRPLAAVRCYNEGNAVGGQKLVGIRLERFGGIRMSSSADGACGGQTPSSSGLGTRTRTRHVSTRAVANNESATDSISSHVAAGLSPSQLASILSRPRIDFSSILTTVSPIVESVRASGDEAVRSYTAEFDRVNLPATSPVCVPIDDASLGGCEGLEEAVVRAFDVAYGNIKAFHEAQKGSGEVVVETMKGVVCRRVGRAIGSVGLYVPGGSAVLPSTALMLAVPAGIAGCKTIVLATPPRQDGMYCYSGRAAASGASCS